MADLTGILGAGFLPAERTVEHLSHAKAGKDLDMNDFLQLMVATFQNQSIDNTADISDMMNQMVQMSVIQAITNINDLFSSSTNMSYAASLVGKEVTVGKYVGKELTQLTGVVTGTGTVGSDQVIFVGNESYLLSDVLAVGRLPQESGAAGNYETPEGEARMSGGSGAAQYAQEGGAASSGETVQKEGTTLAEQVSPPTAAELAARAAAESDAVYAPGYEEDPGETALG